MTDSRFCLSHVCFCVLVDARLSSIVSMEACLKVAILCLRLFELLICSNKFVFKFQDFAKIKKVLFSDLFWRHLESLSDPFLDPFWTPLASLELSWPTLGAVPQRAPKSRKKIKKSVPEATGNPTEAGRMPIGPYPGQKCLRMGAWVGTWVPKLL